jgi:large subunit ribosomal protein L10
MGLNRAEKQTEIESLKERLENNEIIIVTQNKGLTVKQVTQLRNDLRKEGASFKVAKNTLVKIALKGSKFEAISNLFAGPTGIAASKDPAVAKVAQKFAKDNADKFVIVGGAMGDKILNAKDVEVLSKLPSLDELRSTICGLLVSVPTKLAGIMQAPARDLVGVTKAYGEKQ